MGAGECRSAAAYPGLVGARACALCPVSYCSRPHGCEDTGQREVDKGELDSRALDGVGEGDLGPS